MINFNKISEQEKTEIYGQVAEMAREGTSVKEIADILDLTVHAVQSICVDFNIRLDQRPAYFRSLTKQELKWYKAQRLKKVPIDKLAKLLHIDRMFLEKLGRYLKIKVECADCHTIIPNKGKLKRCPPCRKRYQNDRIIESILRRCKTDPAFKAERLRQSNLYNHKKRLLKLLNPS
jgi:tRNA(Ile2) C34 agmatinyltransferase TiaS